MSFPTFPNVTPTISITTGQTIPLLLSSIAFEELALAHILNAEAEKLQFVLGTLNDGTTLFPPVVSITNLLDIDKSVQQTLRDVIMKEMLLEFKFENILELITTPGVIVTPPTPPTPPSPTCAGCSARGGGNQPMFHVNQGNRSFTTAPADLPQPGVMSLDGSICVGCQPNGSSFIFTFNPNGNPGTVQTFSSVFNSSWSISCGVGTDVFGQQALVMTITGIGDAVGTGTGTLTQTGVPFTLTLTTQTSPSLTPTFQLVFDGFNTGVQVAGVGQLQVRNDCV